MINETILTSWHLGDYYTRPLKRMERATNKFTRSIARGKMGALSFGGVASGLAAAGGTIATALAAASAAAVGFGLAVMKIGRYAEDTATSIGAMYDILNVTNVKGLKENIKLARESLIAWENYSKWHAGTSRDYLTAYQSLLPTVNKVGGNLKTTIAITKLIVPTAQLYMGGQPGAQKVALQGVIEMLQGSAKRTNQFVMRFLGAMHMDPREWDRMVRSHPAKAITKFVEQLKKSGKAAELIGRNLTNILGGIETTFEQYFRYGSAGLYKWLKEQLMGFLKWANTPAGRVSIVSFVKQITGYAKDILTVLQYIGREIVIGLASLGFDTYYVRRVEGVWKEYIDALRHPNDPHSKLVIAMVNNVKRHLKQKALPMDRQVIDWIFAAKSGQDRWIGGTKTAAEEFGKRLVNSGGDLLFQIGDELIDTQSKYFGDKVKKDKTLDGIFQFLVKMAQQLQAEAKNKQKLKIEVEIKHDKRYADKVAVAVFDTAGKTSRRTGRSGKLILYTGGGR